MSLFDVIKYPISDRPRVAELEALPPEIYTSWVKSCFVGYAHSPDTLAVFFRTNPGYEDIVQDLRKRIKEYDTR